MKNRLYYGDNLEILRNREYFPDEFVDLIYLDPPFNSNRDHNVLFQSESGVDSEAQITAFEDTWHWGETAERTFDDLVLDAPQKVSTAISALMDLIDRNPMMAYLVMMTVRLVELHRVLKSTGSLYLHCDPTASHYLKIVLDAVFSPLYFRNEIIWRRSGSHGKVKRLAPIHDTILFYTKSDKYLWNTIYKPYMRRHVEKAFVQDGEGWRTNYSGNVLTGSGIRRGLSGQPWRGFDPTPKGRHWAIPGRLLDDIPEDLSDLNQHEKMDRLYELGYIKIVEGHQWPTYEVHMSDAAGQPAPDIWAYQPHTEGTVFGTDEGIDSDVKWLGPRDPERLTYPTQKPEALLERIIRASSNEGDLVLDPFCGCGTAIAAAHKLGREWIGIDITHLSIALQKYRLQNMFELVSGADYEVIGEPATADAARELAQDSANEGRFQFEWWALSLVRAKPVGGKTGSRKGKKGADRGVDGIISFFERIDARKRTCKVIVQVKSGKVKSGDIRDLKGTIEREKAAIGVFITLEKPTQAMIKESLSAGWYESPSWGGRHRRLQILTIDDLFDGAGIDMPPQHGTLPSASRWKREDVSDEGESQRDLI